MTLAEPLSRLNWDRQVLPHIVKLQQERRQVKITIRGLFYILVSLNVLENIQARYKGLSRVSVKWRKKDIVDPDWVVDNSRSIIEIDDSFSPPEERIGDYLDAAARLPKTFKKYYIPRWYKQPHYVEVWVEKNAMKGVLKSILDRYEVRIVPTGGWSSFTYEKDNIRRLKQKIAEGKQVHILYLGDYDPSGLKMDAKVAQRYWDEYGIDLKRISITKEQIQEFDLGHLTNPDPAVLAKLRNDPNERVFRANNDGRLFQIEVDVLQVLDPQILQDLLRTNIEQYFDQEIYDEVMNSEEFSEETIEALVSKLAKEKFDNEAAD